MLWLGGKYGDSLWIDMVMTGVNNKGLRLSLERGECSKSKNECVNSGVH